MKDLGIDLYIFIRFADYSELWNAILASSRAVYIDLETGHSLLGIVNIKREVNYTKKIITIFRWIIIMWIYPYFRIL